MRIRIAGFDAATRIIRIAVLAIGLVLGTAFTSHAGVGPGDATPTATASPTPSPTPSPFCDMACSLDKKCSVGGGPLEDFCTVRSGGEVTYHYQVQLFGGYALVEVEDDKLGAIGQSSGETLTRTAKITETTTNTAEMSLLAIDPGCICLVWEPDDSVTVVVSDPTPTPTSTAPPPTPSATASPPPTPTPSACSATWPVTRIVTIAKGQSPTNNPTLSHAITGHIIDPASLGETAHRIEVCEGTSVSSVVTDASGTPTNTAGGSLACDAAGCSGVVTVTEKYQSISENGRDKDSITLIPK